MLTFDKTVFQQGAFRLQVDLSIPPGGVTALIGPSGAGKSTLLHGIAGFVPQPEGDVRWADASLTGLAPEERPVSMLFQDNNLFPHLTAIQNVALALAPRLWPSLADRKTAEAMLARVGLGDLSDRKPGALSGGQQSRVALARALLQDRPILLLDEPFGALGPKLKAEMLDLTVQLAEG
ncbi:MAG: ATP-binding cassette domain-containing protein, partial [Pseudomonadota bacterium]